MEKGGFGEEFSICSAFCLGGLGGQETKNKFNIEHRVICYRWWFVQRPEVHPRHPPRTFPLWLLAPRCLGLALLLALPLCGAGARAPAVWGEEGILPPSFGLLLVPSESALAQPPF